ncbi:MAG TPA: hypothetical protein VER33_06950 [Polyangiaceae bacterium]|nr:hypothetical protein [Polyangiaceae bacterium]
MGWQPTPSIPRLQAGLRALVSALLLLLTAAQALPSLHFVLVAHEVCPEHGEILHADDGAASHAPDSRWRGPVAAAGSELEHEHEHCSVALRPSSPELSCAALVCVASASLPIAHLLGPAARERGRSSLALLAYAPKLAPPV